MFSVSLREQAMKIINFKKRKMKLLTNEQQSSLSKENEFENKHATDKKCS